MSVAQHSEVDWSGLAPDRSPVAPLNSDTFLQRIRLLNERVNSIRALRAAFVVSMKQQAGEPQDLLDIAQLQDIQARSNK